MDDVDEFSYSVQTSWPMLHHYKRPGCFCGRSSPRTFFYPVQVKRSSAHKGHMANWSNHGSMSPHGENRRALPKAEYNLWSDERIWPSHAVIASCSCFFFLFKCSYVELSTPKPCRLGAAGLRYLQTTCPNGAQVNETDEQVCLPVAIAQRRNRGGTMIRDI